jgi:4-amino-4-deoxy-L-arabinose transferase-like glycosyltransferase/putative flippase GtrA/GT2 family glycosyltransferase
VSQTRLPDVSAGATGQPGRDANSATARRPAATAGRHRQDYLVLPPPAEDGQEEEGASGSPAMAAGGSDTTELVPALDAASQSEGLRVLLSMARQEETSARRTNGRGSRFLVFSAIGGFVFLVGLGLQAVLTGSWHVLPVVSYLVQAVVSVEASFLLNRWLTWRDRSTPFWRAFARFNVQKTITIALNLGLYDVLLRLGMNYLVANVALTAAFTVVNYVAGDRFVFVPGRARSAQPAAPAAPAMKRQHPTPAVSVVIPCRDNARTIGAAVQSLLEQDYPRLREIILIGSPGDHTWSALAAASDPRLSIWELETPPGLRDANFKRDAAIRMTSGDLIALVDSDMVLPHDWMSRAVAALEDSGASCVAGGMKSVHDSFWGRYTDSTLIGAKTPRVAESYTVTSADFGVGGRKPPITANTLFTRELYARCPIDPSWSHGSYEDYEWFWRVARAGYEIRVCRELFGWHEHRRGLRALAREYRRSSRGCAYFIRKHIDCPLAKRRLRQAVSLPLGAIAGAIGVVAAAEAGYGPDLGALVLCCAAVLAVHQVARSRRLESLAYPVAGLALGLVFTTGLVTHLITSGSAQGDASVPRATPRRHRRPRKSALLPALIFTACLAVGTGLRLWHVGTLPGWQPDEDVYYRVSLNVQHGVLSEHYLFGTPFQPFLYQPPFYFLMLSRWFAIFGASIYHARLLGVILTAGMFSLLFRLLWKIHGSHVALFAIIPMIFDGWLMYVERISYIENALILVIAAAFFFYQRALEEPSWQRFAVAGAVLGFAAVFKQTGAYTLLAVLFCWLLTRRSHKGHLVLAGVSLAVVVAYVAIMIRFFDVPGHAWYADQTLDQLWRVLGLQHSGGTLTSPVKALHLLAAQYRMFAASLLAALASFLIAARRLVQCWRVRSFEPVRYNALLLSWFGAGIIVFGLSSLKFPQYFALLLIPMYCFLWTELARWDWRLSRKYIVGGAAVIAGLSAFFLSLSAFSSNPFAEVQRYAATDIPGSSVVVTEQGIGDLIRQPWCTVEHATPCLHAAAYAITWHTYLESSFAQGDPAFHELMKGAARIKSFGRPGGTATIWRLRRKP